MRRSASVVAVAAMMVVAMGHPSTAAEDCWIDPLLGSLICEEDGVVTEPGFPGTDPSEPPDSVDRDGLRYLYERTDPVVGDCHYWSNVPGGLDTWNPANEAAALAIVTGSGACPPVVAVDPETRAWEIFRSWLLDVPVPSLQPAEHGITGLPSYLATNQPATITHSEVLPDGRVLAVRGDVIRLDVSWGDGEIGSYAPEQAIAYPDGAVTHMYLLKTCTAEYRANHPSGGLCHPELEHYTIDVTFDWGGSYNVNGVWVDLGILTRTATVAYDVDEARGVLVP